MWCSGLNITTVGDIVKVSAALSANETQRSVRTGESPWNQAEGSAVHVKELASHVQGFVFDSQHCKAL